MGAEESKPNDNNLFTCFDGKNQPQNNTNNHRSSSVYRNKRFHGMKDTLNNPNNKSPILCFNNPTSNNRRRSPLTPNQRRKKLEQIELENKNKMFNCCGGSNRQLLHMNNNAGKKIQHIKDPSIKLTRTYQNAVCTPIIPLTIITLLYLILYIIIYTNFIL